MADDDFDDDGTLDEPKPRAAKLSILTLVLIFLNWIAAGAFVYLLFMDYRVRQDWSYGVFRNHLAVWGLPLEDEEQSPGYHEAKQRLHLDPDQTKDAFASPGRGGKGGGTFAPVDEPVRFQILPSHMTDEVKKDHFQGLTPMVGTLNDEIKRLKTSVPDAIKKAAEDVAAGKKTDEEKRKAIEQTLLPLSWDIYAVEKLDVRVKKAAGAELDNLLLDALQRRMLADILAPVNIFRPGDVEKYTVEKLADLDTYKLEDLQNLLAKRFDAALAAKYDPEVHYGKIWDENKVDQGDQRDSIEKRQQIGFLLFTLSQVRVPLGVTPLIDKGLERAQVVVGVYDLATAAMNYTRALRVLEERVMDAIRNDREGWISTKDAKVNRSNGFADRYGAEVERLKFAVADNYHADKRLEDLQGQLKRFQGLLTERQEHLSAISKKLVATRTETAETLKEVRSLQRELFEAQRTLADAAERNFQLEAEIRLWEARVKAGALVMLNILGKGLVFVHVLISLVAMTWAAGLFLQFTDWGWKEPKQDLDTRIASEFDKSVAALKQAYRARDLVLPAVKPAQDLLNDAESQYPQNHLFYIQQVQKLRDSTDPIEVKSIKPRDPANPSLPLDTGKATGKPILEDKIEGLDKSLVTLRGELERKKEEIVKVEKAIEAVVEQLQRVTYLLTGKNNAGERETFGLYELNDAEYLSLTEARREKDELKPSWADTLEEARRYTLRRRGLEQTRDRVKKAAGPAPKR